MIKFRQNIFIKMISMFVIISFLSFDIAWSYPDVSIKTNNLNLAVQSPLQINMMGEYGAELQRSVFSRRDICTSVLTVAKYLLDEKKELSTVTDVIGDQLEKSNIPVKEGVVAGRIDLRRVKWKDPKKKTILLIPFSDGGFRRTGGKSTHVIQVARNVGLVKDELIGQDLEFDAVDGKSKYIAKIMKRSSRESPRILKKIENIINIIDKGLDTDANEFLGSLTLEELISVFNAIEDYAGRKDVHAFKRFRAYMILFGSYYVDNRGVRFINAACEPDIEKALAYKKEAYAIYAAEAERLLSKTLEEEGFKFATGLDDYVLRIPESVSGVRVRSGVRIDMSSGFGGDHVLLAMDLGSRAVNASILLKDKDTGKYDYPITVDVKKINQPVIKLRSVDMGYGADKFIEIHTMKELFDFEKDRDVMLAKAAIVASGIVPMKFRDSGLELSDVLNRFGGGFEMVTDVKEIPSGSGLGTSSALASTIVSALVKFSGQSTDTENMTDKEKMLVVARTVLVEEILGSLGGYADSCNIFPAVKLVTTEPGVFLPEYRSIELSDKAERELYDTLILTDGSYRQFSGDAAWQFAGLWVMRPKNVYEARMNTMRIGAVQSDLMEKGDIRGFGRLEGADYVNRTNICPAGDNEYVRRVNALLIEELGPDAFWFDVTGARGGAGGCYWLNTKVIEADRFKDVFLKVSRQAISELKNKINFEGEPRIYDYRLNKKGIEIEIVRSEQKEVKNEELNDAGAEIILQELEAIDRTLTAKTDGIVTIDLRDFDDNDSEKILEWRKQLVLEKRYEGIQKRLMYDIPREPAWTDTDGTEIYIPGKGIKSEGVVIHKRELPGAFDGMDARVIYLENRPKEAGERIRLCKFLYGDLEYNCGPRLSPYSFGHIVAGTDSLPQQLDNDGAGLKFFLILSRIFGEGYEGFFNAIAPTSDTFHAQYVRRRTTIWDAEDIVKWPIKAELVEGEKIDNVVKRALKIYNRYNSETEYLESTCDVLMTFKESEQEPGKGKYRIILIPRLKGNEERGDKGFLKPHSKPYSDPALFGTFGGLEVGGCFMAADRTLEAFRALMEGNGTLYKRGMEEMSWTGSGTRERFEEYIDRKAEDAVRTGTSSEYRVENLSPEEALRYLLVFLRKVSNNSSKYDEYLSHMFEMRQDEFEKVSDECLVEMRDIFDRLPRDQFHVMTRFYPETVYNAYSRLFRYCRENIGDITAMLGGWENRISDYNYVNRSIFADGEGGYFVDDYGMPGEWEVELRTKDRIPNRLILCTVDAFYKALREKDPGFTINERIVLTDDMPEDLIYLNDDFTGFSPDKNTIYVSAGMCHLSRDEQQKLFAGILKDVPRRKLRLSAVKTVPKMNSLSVGERPALLAATVSMVETGRARDYLHRKFNYRVQAAVQGMRKEGKDVAFIPVETPLDYEALIERYKREKQDIVMLSLYQLKRAEINIIHNLVPNIKSINPDAFIVVEGPFTIHAKQALALCPEIDMMVRGEADKVVSLLMEVKTKGKALTEEMMRYILHQTEGGVFVRGRETCFISNLDKTVINQDIRMLIPEREMETIWYPEHGCPHRCAFCRKDTGGFQHKRIVSADKRVDWMLGRLMLEVDPTCGVTSDNLREILKQQAEDRSKRIDTANEVKLLPDTFIGRDKVEIVIVSENALVNRKVMMEFCELIRGLGLQKYFSIKIADASIPMLIREGKPDREYVRSLRNAGVYFIGFGSEHLSRTILAGLAKGWTEDIPEGYTADDIIAVNKVLMEEGFDPACIRNNMLLNTPDSNIEDIKSGMLLMYLAPIYNSVYSYFSNGWGNARNSRVYVMEGTLWTAADTVRYASKYKFKDQLDSSDYLGKDYLFTDHFYVAKDTPEYSLRAEDAPLNYIDERIHPLSGDFAYPHFYRYRVSDFLKNNFYRSDIRRAVDSWRDRKQGLEVNALAGLFDTYSTAFSELDGLDVIKMLKAHMVALGELSFSGYEELLGNKKNMPEAMEICGVSGLVLEGDSFMEPGRFDPDKAMACFIKAHLMAMIVKEMEPSLFAGLIDSQIKKEFLDVAEKASNMYENPDNIVLGTVDMFSSSSVPGRSEFSKVINKLVSEAVRERDAIKKSGYLSRMSYPDQQIFEYIKHVYATKSDGEIYDMIVRRMNQKKIEFQKAIQELTRERMETSGKPFTAEDYREYVKAVKEYENMSVFGRNGMFDRLDSTDPETVFSAIRELVEVASKEKNRYILRSIALTLRDISSRHTPAGRIAFVVLPSTLRGLRKQLGMESEGNTLFDNEGSSLILMSDEIYNSSRVALVKKLFSDTSKMSVNIVDDISKGDWNALRFEGNNVELFGTNKSDNDEFLKKYAERMRFGKNTVMFEHYLSRMSEISGRHISFLKRKIEEGFRQLGDRMYTRHVMLMEERFLYMLPLIRMMVLDPDLKMIFLGRGMEPFYNTLSIFSKRLDLKNVLNNSIYTGMYRYADHSDPQNHFMARSIIPMLTEKEAEERVADNLWNKIIKKAESEGISKAIEKELNEKWGELGGLLGLKAKKLKRREAVVLLSNFGLDKRFIDYCVKVRESYLGSAFINGSFGVLNIYGGNDLAKDMLSTDRVQTYLSERNKQAIREGLKKLEGEDGTVLALQRELLHGYARIFGYGEEVGKLKGKIEHKGRSLLNLLLEDTDMSRKFKNASGVVCVDEASVSGLSLLLTEAVVRCFNGSSDMNYKTHNVSQRTEDTDAHLKKEGVLDSTSISGIWPQEDTNEEFLGMYVDDEVREKKFLTFKELTVEFMKIQKTLTPDKSAKEIRTWVEMFDKKIDEYIRENGLFGFVDKIESLRYDAFFIKREFLKLLMRFENKDIKPELKAVLESVFINDLARGITVFEADSPVMFTFKDAIKEYRSGKRKGFSIPDDLLTVDAKLWSADMCRYFKRYEERAKEMVMEYADILSWFGKDDTGGASAGAFVRGKNEFDVTAKYFYEKFFPDNGKIAFDNKKIYTGNNGKKMYVVYRGTGGDLYVEIFSAAGLDSAMKSKDKGVRKAALEARERIKNDITVLDNFIMDNRNSSEKNIIELVRIAGDILNEKKTLLTDPEYTDPVFKRFNLIPSFTVDTRKKRILSKVPKPLNVEIPVVHRELALELERNGLLNIPEKTLHLAYVKTASGDKKRMFNLVDPRTKEKIENGVIFDIIEELDISGPVSLHIGWAMKDFEAIYENGSDGKEHLLMDEETAFNDIVENIKLFKRKMSERGLKNEILLENIGYFPGSKYVQKHDFIRRVVDETGCGFLIDLGHIAYAGKRGDSTITGEGANTPIDYLKKIIDTKTVKLLGEVHISIPWFDRKTGQWEHSGVRKRPLVSFSEDTEGVQMVKELLDYIIDLRKKTGITKTHPLIVNFETNDDMAGEEVRSLSEMLKNKERGVFVAKTGKIFNHSLEYEDKKHMNAILEMAERIAQEDSGKDQEDKRCPVTASVVDNKTGEMVSETCRYVPEVEDGRSIVDDHAEMVVLKRAVEKWGRKDLSDCTLYVTLENCYYCAKAAVKNFGISRVVVGCLDANIGEIGKAVAETSGVLHSVISDGELHRRAKAVIEPWMKKTPSKIVSEAIKKASEDPEKVFKELVREFKEDDEYPELFDWAGSHFLKNNLLLKPESGETSQICVVNAEMEWKIEGRGDDILTHLWKEKLRINPGNDNLKIVVVGKKEKCEKVLNKIKESDVGLGVERLFFLPVVQGRDPQSLDVRPAGEVINATPSSVIEKKEEEKDKASTKATKLFEIVEGEMNNRRDRMVEQANRIVSFLKERDEITVDTEPVPLSRDMLTLTLIRQLKLVADEGIKYADETDIFVAAEDIRKNLDLLEIDSVVTSIIIKARETARFHRTLTVALDLSWIPGYGDNKIVRDTVNPVVSKLRLLENALRSMELDNVRVVIRKWNESKEEYESVDAWQERITEGLSSAGDYSDVIVFGSMGSVKYYEEKWISDNISPDKRGFLAGVDASRMNMEDLSPGDYWNIEIMKMFSVALEAFAGKDVSSLSIIDPARSNMHLRRIIFLPKAEPQDIGEIMEKFKAKRLALVSA